MRHLANGSIKVPEGPSDLTEMYEWMERQHTLVVDTETSSLDIYLAGFRLRLIVLATPSEAWVYPFEVFGRSQELEELLTSRKLVFCNAPFDIKVLSKELHIPMDVLWSRTRDTQLMQHQIDPRGREEGGIGMALAELVNHYLPGDSKLEKKFKWDQIPIWDEEYLLYAGTDGLITARLFKVLKSLVDVNSELTRADHKTAMIACMMDAKGFLLDREYAEALATRLFLEEAEWKVKAHYMGLTNINSPQQVYQALTARGFVIVEKTPKGNPKVDKVFLEKHRDDALVEAIIEGKKAGKWRTTWVEKFLNSCDSVGRVHPSTNTLRARTARFSITGIPAQTLPSQDSLVRSCFVADTDQIVIGVDYSQQELRFAAAHSKDPKLIKVFRDGHDPYLTVAELAHPGHGAEHRKSFKVGVLGSLYGGGVRKLADQTGMSDREARTVIDTIRKGYSGLDRRSKALAAEAEQNGYITTWTGRKLPVEASRSYAAMNYYTQSGSRDITAFAMHRLYDAGFVDYMRLAIHDEILFSGPNDPEFIHEIERIMSTSYGKVQIPAEAKIGSRSWGSLYEGK